MSATARFSLERTIGLVLGVVLIALSVLSFVAHRQFAGLEQTTRWAIESRETVLALESLVRAVVDAETGQRGYLLTSRDRYLGPYRSGVDATLLGLADIRRRTESDPLQAARFDRLQALTQSKLAELAYTIALHPVDPAASLAVVRGNDGQHYMDEIRGTAAAMSRHERGQLASRSDAARVARSRTETMIGGALTLLFAFAGASYLLVRSELRRRAAVTAELLESRRRLAQNEALLKAVTDHMPGLIAYIDRGETYRFTNAHYKTLYGLEPASYIGKSIADVLGADAYRAVREKVDAALRGEPQSFERQGNPRGVESHFKVDYIPDADARGEVAGFFMLVVDITERKQAELRLLHQERLLRTDITSLQESRLRLEALARVDALTGLANRRQFDERLGRALARAARERRPLALMYLDLDHFKSINDSLGHDQGDCVLREFAARLDEAVRSTDLAARLGGDEFVVLLEGPGSEDDARRTANRILAAVRADFMLTKGPMQITASIGVAFTDDGDLPAELLLKCADEALYRSKRAGRDRFHLDRVVAGSARPAIRLEAVAIG